MEREQNQHRFTSTEQFLDSRRALLASLEAEAPSQPSPHLQVCIDGLRAEVAYLESQYAYTPDPETARLLEHDFTPPEERV